MTRPLQTLCQILVRITLLAALFVAPAGAFALARDGSNLGQGGIGFVLYVTLQRASMS